MSTNTYPTALEYAHDAHGHTVVVGTAAGGGVSPSGVADWVRNVDNHGHAVTYVPTLEPTAHRVSGCGMAHNDAAFCERRGDDGSMASYYENGAAYGGRWWEDTDSPLSVGVKHYGCADRSGGRDRRDAASKVLAAAGGVA